MDNLPSECKIMFVAERPSGHGKEMSSRTRERFCLFQNLRREFSSKTYATDCIKTERNTERKTKSWKEKAKENDNDFEKQKKYLKREIDCLDPSVVVQVGNEARRLIEKHGMKEWIESRGKKLDRIMHYSYRFNGYFRFEDFKPMYQKEFRDLKERIGV